MDMHASDCGYKSGDGYTLKRSDAYPFIWELRDPSGKVIDRNKYRHDIGPGMCINLVGDTNN